MVLRAYFRLVLVNSVLVLAGLSTVLGQRPPQEYNLSDLRIVLTHSIFMPLSEYQASTTILGNGQVRYQRSSDGKKRAERFELPDEAIRQILREVYDIHFFELSDTYVKKTVIQFLSDGSVHEESSIANHAWNVTVTVQIGEYRKSVRYDSHGVPPLGLKEFVDRLESQLSEYIPAE